MTEIFLIHDPARVDRERLFKKELYEQGIDIFESVPAVKSFSAVKNIAQAHKNCIRKAVARDLPRIVVMEDDIMFACPSAYTRFLELVDQLDSATKGEWDILTAGSYDYKYAKVPEYIGLYIARIARFAGLHCYAVNKRYYQRFLLMSEDANIDKALTGRLYMTWPMLALQYDGYSDNVKRKTQYNETFKDKVELWNCNP